LQEEIREATKITKLILDKIIRKYYGFYYILWGSFGASFSLLSEVGSDVLSSISYVTLITIYVLLSSIIFRKITRAIKFYEDFIIMRRRRKA
jgi:hypothetical protein